MISRKRFNRANEVAAKLYYIWHLTQRGTYSVSHDDKKLPTTINKKWFGMYRSTRKFCTKFCCKCSKRAYLGPTRKEEISAQNFREQIRELNV